MKPYVRGGRYQNKLVCGVWGQCKAGTGGKRGKCGEGKGAKVCGEVKGRQSKKQETGRGQGKGWGGRLKTGPCPARLFSSIFMVLMPLIDGFTPRAIFCRGEESSRCLSLPVSRPSPAPSPSPTHLTGMVAGVLQFRYHASLPCLTYFTGWQPLG